MYKSKGAMWGLAALFVLLVQVGPAVGIACGASKYNNWIAYSKGTSIWRMKPDGTSAKKMAKASTYSAVAWSPGHKRAAYIRGGCVWTVQANGAKQARVRYKGPWNKWKKGRADLGCIAWSPSGRYIAYSDFKPTSLGDQVAWLVVIDTKRHTSRRLISFWNNFESISFLPDGKSLLVGEEGGDSSELKQISFPKGKTLRTYTGSVSGACASSDGKRIMCTISDVQTGEHSVRVMNVDGSGSQVVYASGNPWGGTWSPDGGKIAFCVSDQSGYHIVTMNPDATGEVDLAAGCHPCWR
jgi:hypothetical protein